MHIALTLFVYGANSQVTLRLRSRDLQQHMNMKNVQMVTIVGTKLPTSPA